MVADRFVSREAADRLQDVLGLLEVREMSGSRDRFESVQIFRCIR